MKSAAVAVDEAAEAAESGGPRLPLSSTVYDKAFIVSLRAPITLSSWTLVRDK